MTIKINYPSDESDIKILEDNIAEFKATLFLESIEKLNISEDSKKEILRNLIKCLN
jgi:hypothetical protein